MKTRFVILGTMLLLMVCPLRAQKTDATEAQAAAVTVQSLPKYFHLDFVLKEVEAGKTVNSRSYTMVIAAYPMDKQGGMSLINTQSRSIRVGGRVPIEVAQNRFQSFDVGVNIDCRDVVSHQDRLAMIVSAQISSIPLEAADSVQKRLPTVRQNKWMSDVIVTLGKPTVLFMSDDVTSKRAMELELTATPIR